MDEQIEEDATDSPVSEFFIGIGILVLAGYMILEGLNYPAGKGGDPGSFSIPLLVAILMIIAGVIIVAMNAKKMMAKREESFLELLKSNAKVFIFIGVLIATVIVMPIIGYTVTMAVSLFIITKNLGSSWLRSAIVAVLGSVASYYLFQVLFSVPLPTGMMGF